MPSTERHDPYAGFNFRVEIDGVVAAAFSECCGLSSETEVVSYREGGDLRVRRLPGLTKYANLVLKHGITLDRSLWNWRQTVVNGVVERRNGSVILLDADTQGSGALELPRRVAGQVDRPGAERGVQQRGHRNPRARARRAGVGLKSGTRTERQKAEG